jgi:hypothetical protein
MDFVGEASTYPKIKVLNIRAPMEFEPATPVKYCPPTEFFYNAK